MELGLRDLLGILKAQRWLILLSVLICVVVALTVTLRQSPSYLSVSKVEIQPVLPSDTSVLEKLLDPGWALTQAELISSDAVLSLASQETGTASIPELRESLRVELVPETQVVAVSVTRPSPEEAAEWSNAISHSFLEYRREQAIENGESARAQVGRRLQAIDEEIAAIEGVPESGPRQSMLRTMRASLELQLIELPDIELLSNVGGIVISPAQPPGEPIGSRFAVTLVGAGLLGGLIGLGIAVVLETLNDQLQTPEEIEGGLSVPALGYVPFVKAWEGNKIRQLADDSPASGPVLEAYRTLGINLMAASKGTSPGCILITSAVANAGKSTTSANLAATLARNGNKVILVAGDLRKASIHKFFQLPNMNGIVDVVHDGQPLYEALQQNSIPNFRLLAAGGSTANPTATLGSKRFTEILADLKAISDVVIIDSTPILGLGDASVLASKVDAVILVVNKDAARGRELAHAAQQVAKAGGRLIGCVINGLDPQETYSGYYDYGRN